MLHNWNRVQGIAGHFVVASAESTYMGSQEIKETRLSSKRHGCGRRKNKSGKAAQFLSGLGTVQWEHLWKMYWNSAVTTDEGDLHLKMELVATVEDVWNNVKINTCN